MQDKANQHTQPCPLCDGIGTFFQADAERLFFLCETCSGVFLHKMDYPDLTTEKDRYMEHNNDVEDVRYQRFVSPIVEAVMRDFETKHKGLDFGAGTGPVISKLLLDKHYDIVQYDPFFLNKKELLQKKYDYIACCEVIEHFHQPKEEFIRLKKMLTDGGRIYCMTDIYYPTMDFQRWYYKTDPTHVFFYQEDTFCWIKEQLGFSKLTINKRLITMYN